MYFQGMFVNDRIKALAPEHPEWKRPKMPFKAVLDGDIRPPSAPPARRASSSSSPPPTPA